MESLLVCCVQICPEVWSESRGAFSTDNQPFDSGGFGCWEEIEARAAVDAAFEMIQAAGGGDGMGRAVFY